MSNLAPRDMVHVPGGTFRMGSDRHYPEEAPAHNVALDPLWIDAHPLTLPLRPVAQMPNYRRRYRPAARHAQPVDRNGKP
jgi:formylglycine-generating enzyme required for sulfatase activity